MRKEIHQEVLRSAKLNKLLESVIAQEHILVREDELLEEAKTIAQRQNTTLDMVKDFFGADLAGLEPDVRKKKAIWLIYQNAIIR